MQKFESAQAFKFAILFIIGVFIGAGFEFNVIVVIAIIIIQIIFLFYFYKKSEEKNINLILLASLVISLGIFKADIDFHLLPDNSISLIPDTKRNEETKLIGVIEDIPTCDTNKIRFGLESEFIINEKTHDTALISGNIIVTLKRNPKTDLNEYQINQNEEGINLDRRPELKAGDRVLMYGKLSEPFEERNPGEFDYKRYLRLHDIYKTFTVTGYDNIEIINRDNLGFTSQYIIYPAKKFASDNIDKYIGGDEGAFLKGLVTGERADISKKIKEDFIKTGVMHIIAVSGLNVAYIILGLTLILSLFRIPRTPKVIIIIIILIFYCFFTGAPASIIRATVMGSLILISGVMQRKTNFYNIIGISVLIILIYDSKQLFDPGFILSFSAVLSMVIFYEKFDEILLQKILKTKIKFKKSIYLVTSIIFISFAAQLGTLPITSHYFEKISFVSLIANAIVVPISNLSLAIGFFQIIAGIFSGFLSSVIADVNFILLKFQLLIINYFASFKFGYTSFYGFNTINTIGYFVILFLIFTFKKENLKLKILLLSISIVILIILNLDFRNNLRITFLYAGQGDCTLLETPDGSNILIDCGMKDFKYNSGESNIVPFLKRKGINKIDLLILTHSHYDHIGGIEYVLNNFDVKKIIHNGTKENNSLIRNMENLIISNKIPRDRFYSGDYIQGYGNLMLFFLNPEKGDSLQSNEHTKSIVLKLKYENTEVLLLSDLNVEGESFITNKYGNFLKSNILKVSHHGSKNASSIPFLMKSKPEYAVISCGKDNIFGHPSELVQTKLDLLGANILRTDKDGAIIFESDGKTLELVKWK
ncbi:MAG: DNA internalization-related competence protein ComEC/Rec2 [Ignavibacteria bacterium]|jgi:competence protein ComEC